MSRFTEFKAEPLLRQSEFEVHADDRYHVNDLLPYHDRNFIQNAYRAILKRGPDATGYNSFIESLHSGRLNKIDILARLRYSTEGRAKRVRIDGLLFPALVRSAYKLPVVGYLLNLVVALARLPQSIRHQRQFEAHVLTQQDQIVDYANRVNAAFGALADEVSAALTRVQESATRLAEQQREQLSSLVSEQEQLESLAGEQQQQLAAFASEQRKLVESLASEHRQNLESFAGEQRARAESLAGEQRQHLESFASEHQQSLESLADEQRTRVELLAGEQHRYFESFASEQRQDLTRAQAQLEQLQKLIEAQREEVESSRTHFGAETAGLENRFETRNSQQQTKFELLAKELRAELAHIFAKQQETRSELVLQAQRANVMLEKARQQLSAPRGKEYLKALAAEADHTLDAFYLALEEQFRGSRAEIKDRLKIYLPLITEAGIGTKQTPILDVGCGRGEWLELLGENELRATGIDSNRMQVARCRELGLEVTEGELLAYLRSVPDSSLGAVTGFHIAEHLPIETLVAFLDETVRVVKPGGAVILETPNPQNVLVGSCNFYFDPTHRNPLPSPVLQFLIESRGFQRIQVLNLNPSDEAPVKGNTDLARRFNQYFYGPMDYAVVGWRS